VEGSHRLDDTLFCLVRPWVRSLALVTEGFCGFTQSLHTDVRTVPQIMPWLSPSRSFLIHFY
jgi:hypothetical protein